MCWGFGFVIVIPHEFEWISKGTDDTACGERFSGAVRISKCSPYDYALSKGVVAATRYCCARGSAWSAGYGVKLWNHRSGRLLYGIDGVALSAVWGDIDHKTER